MRNCETNFGVKYQKSEYTGRGVINRDIDKTPIDHNRAWEKLVSSQKRKTNNFKLSNRFQYFFYHWITNATLLSLGGNPYYEPY